MCFYTKHAKRCLPSSCFIRSSFWSSGSCESFRKDELNKLAVVSSPAKTRVKVLSITSSGDLSDLGAAFTYTHIIYHVHIICVYILYNYIIIYHIIFTYEQCQILIICPTVVSCCFRGHLRIAYAAQCLACGATCEEELEADEDAAAKSMRRCPLAAYLLRDLALSSVLRSYAAVPGTACAPRQLGLTGALRGAYAQLTRNVALDSKKRT